MIVGFYFFFIILFCEMFCRFGGSEFPPIILFKIFIHSGGHGVKYYCGKKVIKPASEVTKYLLSVWDYLQYKAMNFNKQWSSSSIL